MKKTIQLLITTFILSSSLYGQSTERFIRIIGNAKTEISANKAKIQFSISEQKSSKYNEKSTDISFEEAYDTTINKLSEIGIEESDLELVIQAKSYSKGKSKSYTIITDIDKLKQVSNIQDDIMQIKEIRYLFDFSDEDLETELSLIAINDAKRKAKALCDEINMKVGKILNIEVKETSYGTEKIVNSKEDMIKSYRLAITFKLVD